MCEFLRLYPPPPLDKFLDTALLPPPSPPQIEKGGGGDKDERSEDGTLRCIIHAEKKGRKERGVGGDIFQKRD